MEILTPLAMGLFWTRMVTAVEILSREMTFGRLFPTWS
jgi:hypothetical protein